MTIADGRGNPIPNNAHILVRLLNGAKEIDPFSVHGSDVTINDIDFTGTDDDASNVFASARGYDETVTPDRVSHQGRYGRDCADGHAQGRAFSIPQMAGFCEARCEHREIDQQWRR
jgi:hypothetical protein